MKVKAEFSNAVRVEQIQVLTETNPIIGSGLGHNVSGGGVWRQYDGDTYFELQTLYIYNQIGIIGLGTFYLLTLIPYARQKKRKKLMPNFLPQGQLLPLVLRKMSICVLS